MNYIFNPIYKLKNDKDRILLTNNKKFADNEIMYFVHPAHAILLSYFDGSRNIKETIDSISKDFGIDKQITQKLVANIICNNEEIHFHYDGTTFTLPPQILVQNKDKTIRDDLDSDNLIIEGKLDFQRRRLGRPINLLICINLKCVTDCIYCYAHRKVAYKPLSPKKWVDLIYKAKKTGIDTIEITGGEFFLNSGWEEIAQALVACDYAPDISTKVPLTHDIIDRIVATGLKTVQFSLDTVDQELAEHNLNVGSGYINKLLNAIRYCDEKELEVIIKPSMNKDTCTIENVNSIIDFAKTLKHLRRCVFTIIGYSCFKSEKNYLKIRPTLKQVEEVAHLVEHRASEMSCPMYNDNQLYHLKEMKNFKKFKNRALCTANIDGLVVLPDGQVTICEELYWNKNFILGDVKKNTIEEIWNSPRAFKLWNISQDDIPEDSACKTCQDFENCRRGLGVCWKIVLAAYGQDKPFYPDPRCPKSPKIKYHFVAD